MQLRIKFIFKTISPYRLSASTITIWIAALYHKVINNSMKNKTIIITAFCMGYEIFHCFRRTVGK